MTRLRTLALIAVLALTGLTIGARVVATTVRMLPGTEPQALAPFELERAGTRVGRVDAEAQEAGLQVGDHLLAVGGRPYTGQVVLGRALAASKPGDRISIGVEREGGGRLDLQVPLKGAPAQSGQERMLALVLTVFMPVLSVLVGFIVALRRPEDPRAWLLLALLLSFGTITDSGIDPTRWPAVLRWPSLTFAEFANATWPLWMMLFGIYFPERARLDRRWPWAKWLVGVPLLASAVVGVVLRVGTSENLAAVAPLARVMRPTGTFFVILTMVAIGSFFALLGEKSFTLTSPDSRRRIRLLQAGATLALTPMFILVLVSLATKRGVMFNQGLPVLAVVALLALALFPITLAYVIVVQRALDVGVVIRQGLQYALAQNGILVLRVVISMAVILGAASLAGNPAANRPRRLTFIAGGIALVVLTQRLAERLKTWTDRRFFREALDTERVLNELAEDVRTLVDAHELLDTVARRLSDALHVPRVGALLRQGEGCVLVLGVGLGEPLPAVTFAETGPVAQRLREEGKPLLVYPDDPHSWSHTASERPLLERLGAQLLIPMLLKDQLLGFLALSPKLSEQAYAPSDLRLLRSVGGQVALALENARLTSAVAAEVARRERLNRELEIAREVQEQLFPQGKPKVPGLDYAALCRPARGVGGDYYDFVDLPSGSFGLAIGDVSGKGIPAALLMASLQASLRGQATFGTTDLAQLMGRVNRLMCDSSAINRYATFFYGEYQPTSRVLRYVNAGHNPPMLVRSDGEVVRLDAGGPVVGLLDLASYMAAEVTLRPGDRFIAFTDGVSEAMNSHDEEWGEEHLLEAFRACDGLSPAEAIGRVIAGADAFAAGAPQHDDMTLVVAAVVA